ncbi:MAG: sensor histidine kinase, partial [Pseudomonadota bacterium]|nr:sensor histidine kinase [Pseudomonadota bacterium]
MQNTMHASPLFARWLALGAAAGAAIALAMEQAGWGSMRLAALVLVLLALFGVIAIVLSLRRHDIQFRARAHHAERGRAEVDALQREIRRHQELEHQLQQAKATAESVVLAKGEFLATMSHEIRTPLNGVIPMLDLLLSMSLPQNQRDLVRTAYASSQQLLRIVDDILDYSKLEANRLELESTVFNLRELIEDVTQWMRHPADIKGLRLHLHM